MSTGRDARAGGPGGCAGPSARRQVAGRRGLRAGLARDRVAQHGATAHRAVRRRVAPPLVRGRGAGPRGGRPRRLFRTLTVPPPTTPSGTARAAVLGEELGDGALPRVVDLRAHPLHRAPSAAGDPGAAGAPCAERSPARCRGDDRAGGGVVHSRVGRGRMHTRRLLRGRDDFVTWAATLG